MDVNSAIKGLKSNLTDFYWSSMRPQGHIRLGLTASVNVDFVFDLKGTYTIKRCIEREPGVYSTLSDLPFSKDTTEGTVIQALMHDVFKLFNQKDFSKNQEDNYGKLVAATESYINKNFS